LAGISATVVGVGAGILGTVLYLRGTEKLHDYQAAIESNGKIPWNPDNENWRTTRDAGVGFLVASGVGVVGGITMFLIGSRPGDDRGSAARIALVPGMGSVALWCQGAF
jgi:hypothetical protein